MESNWRIRPFQIGWQLGPYELAAHLLGTPLRIYATKKFTDDGLCDIMQVVVFGQVAVRIAQVAIDPVHPHFPYQFNVEAD